MGHLPFVGTASAISAFVWMLAVAYLYTEVTTDERALGVFIAPLLVGLQTISSLSRTVSEPAPILDSPLLAAHVLSLLFAYAAFALRVRRGHHLRPAVPRAEGQAARVLRGQAAVAARGGRDERARGGHRVALP